MSIFEYTPEELLGTVESVDTSTVIVKVENDDKLRGLQVNHLISIQSSSKAECPANHCAFPLCMLYFCEQQRH